jgi:hypothetical protein
VRQSRRARIRVHRRAVRDDQQRTVRFAFHAYNFTTENTEGTEKRKSKFSP